MTRSIHAGALAIAFAAAAASTGCRTLEDASSEPSAIEGRLVSAADGSPLEGDVVLTIAGNGEWRETVASDPDGRFFIDGLHQAPYDLVATSGERKNAVEVDVEGGTLVSVSEIELFEPVIVEGHVELGPRRRAKGYWVSCIADGNVRVAWSFPRRELETDEEGRFGFDERWGRKAIFVVESPQGEQRVFRKDLPLEGGRFPVILFWPAGTPIDGESCSF